MFPMNDRKTKPVRVRNGRQFIKLIVGPVSVIVYHLVTLSLGKREEEEQVSRVLKIRRTTDMLTLPDFLGIEGVGKKFWNKVGQP